jgi:hypothetical protein
MVSFLEVLYEEHGADLRGAACRPGRAHEAGGQAAHTGRRPVDGEGDSRRSTTSLSLAEALEWELAWSDEGKKASNKASEATEAAHKATLAASKQTCSGSRLKFDSPSRKARETAPSDGVKGASVHHGNTAEAHKRAAEIHREEAKSLKDKDRAVHEAAAEAHEAAAKAHTRASSVHVKHEDPKERERAEKAHGAKEPKAKAEKPEKAEKGPRPPKGPNVDENTFKDMTPEKAEQYGKWAHGASKRIEYKTPESTHASHVKAADKHARAARAYKALGDKAKTLEHAAKATEHMGLADDEGRWITIHGRHVFMRDGETPKDAIDRMSGKLTGNKDTEYTPPVLVDGRPDLTRTGDVKVLPKQLLKHLSVEQQQGASLAVKAMETPPNGFILADGTGAGKTREELAVAQTFAERGHPVIMITRSEVIKPNWGSGKVSGSFADDSEAMGIKLHLNKGDTDIQKGEIHVTTYDNLLEVAKKMPKNTMIIWDEAHSLKNDQSSRALVGNFMNENAAGVMYASATPADKSVHLEYMKRAGVFGSIDPDAAHSELGMVKKVTPGGHEIWSVNPHIGKEAVAARLQKVFDKLTEKGRMIKREISMDGVGVHFEKVPMPQECKNQMAAVENIYSDQRQKGVVYLQQRRLQEIYKVPRAVQVTNEDVKQGRQVVIFADRVNDTVIENKKSKYGEKIPCPSTINTLKAELIKSGIKEEDIVEIHGGVSKSVQRRGMDKFQAGKAKVVIATIASGGTGINLDDRHGDKPRTVVMMTAPLSPVDNVQAAGRVWRATTKSNPRLHYIFGDTPIDEWNSKLIAGKMSTLKAVVNGEVGKLSTPQDLSDEGVAEAIHEAMNGPRRVEAPRSSYGSRFGYRRHSQRSMRQARMARQAREIESNTADWNPSWLQGDNIGWSPSRHQLTLPDKPSKEDREAARAEREARKRAKAGVEFSFLDMEW